MNVFEPDQLIDVRAPAGGIPPGFFSRPALTQLRCQLPRLSEVPGSLRFDLLIGERGMASGRSRRLGKAFQGLDGE